MSGKGLNSLGINVSLQRQLPPVPFFSLEKVQKCNKGADTIFFPWSYNIQVKRPSSSSHLPNGGAAEANKVAKEVEQGRVCGREGRSVCHFPHAELGAVLEIQKCLVLYHAM